MPRVKEVHSVGPRLDVVGPAGRFDEGSASVVAEVVDGGDKVSKVDGGVGVELVEFDLGDGSSEHVAYVPPSDHQGWEQQKQQRSHLYYNDK